ncbi:trigger factor [Patescibacteria group bacterium]|nr:trigger factor [Patescibacteria group bacterium]MBU2259288.1 trigger factor [Patescibacteria group bacterium]
MTTKSTAPKKDKSGRTTFTITFTKEEITPAEESALKKLGSAMKIEGFRPGKVPLEMLRDKVSPDQLLEETIRALLPDTIKRLTKENEIRPITPPKIEAQNREPLTLQITFIEHPEVTVRGVDKIKVEKKPVKVDDKDIERTLDYFLEQHMTTKDILRSAKKGDRITMDFHGEDSDGKEIDGIRTTGHQVILGSDTLIPGFEEELDGMEKADKKTFTITFPEEYHAQHLRKKPVTFHVKVTNVEEVFKPKLTDAFVQQHLDADSAESFKNRVRESMEQQEERINDQKREQELLEKIRKATKVELAPELIEEEERDLFENFARELKERSFELSDWMKKMKKKPEDIKADMNKQAVDRLTLRLGIQHLADEKGTDLTDKEMKQAVAEFLAPLEPEQRAKIEPMYQKGYQGWHQLKWQKRVEKLISQMLGT